MVWFSFILAICCTCYSVLYTCYMFCLAVSWYGTALFWRCVVTGKLYLLQCTLYLRCILLGYQMVYYISILALYCAWYSVTRTIRARLWLSANCKTLDFTGLNFLFTSVWPAQSDVSSPKRSRVPSFLHIVALSVPPFPYMVSKAFYHVHIWFVQRSIMSTYGAFSVWFLGYKLA